MSLSVCLLTRNEAATVARAIESVCGIADEVLVADTGSSDGTADAAAKAGGSVSQFAWEDDFAAGRNHLIERAKGDWILWLDAKEQFAGAQASTLQVTLAQPGVFGFFVRIQHFSSDGTKSFSATSDLRLVRRRGDLKYIGRLHPHLEAAAVEAVKREGISLAAGDVTLQHYEDRNTGSEPKLRWTLRLLELELRDRPGQLHYLIELGRTLQMLKDPRAGDVLAQAATQVVASKDASNPPSAKVQVLLGHVLTHKPENFPIDLHLARELAVKWFGNSPPLLWTIAHGHFSAGEYDQAAQALERLAGLGKSGKWDRTQPFPPEILAALPLMNLGKCYLKLGRGAEAEACFLQVVADPDVGREAAGLLAEARAAK
jgi:hypothetical protein